MEDVQRRRVSLQTSPASPPRPLLPPPRSLPPSPRPPPLQSPSPPLDLDDSDSDDPPPDVELPYPVYHKLRPGVEFAELLKEATLASQFGPEELADFLDPREHISTPPDDPDLMLSLLNYIDLLPHSQEAYEAVRQNLQHRYPETGVLSHWQVERRARILSGLVTWQHHMCVKSCVGFTGPYANLEDCPRCGASRYRGDSSGGDKKIPQKIFTTFPLGPQLQARWKNPQTAKGMLYRWDTTLDLLESRASGRPPTVLDDILSGEAYLKLAQDGTIRKHDTVLLLSVDGAQLYESKKSDCWIYIWILVDLSPDKRYKIRNILPGGVIPGPDSLQNIDSFMLPGLVHLSALQKEGLPIWDSFSRERATCFPYLFLVLTDSVAMEKLSGSVGHHGRKGCRLLCGFTGRNKLHGAHYYPALLRPDGFEDHPSSSHADVEPDALPIPSTQDYHRDLLYVLNSTSETNYRFRRLHTGIGKASIFTRIPRILPLPTCFGGDLMHQPLINLGELLLDLWCNQPDVRTNADQGDWDWAVLVGHVWVRHGKAVADAGNYLPTSFGRIPRNPQEKISSGYKASELLVYLYGLGPAVLYGVLPEPYYSHFCMLVRAIRLIFQHSLTLEQVDTAHRLLLQWAIDFERHYCQRNPHRLHFVRQCVHSVTHLGRETNRLGPLCLSSQWTMERVIGYFGSLIRQPSKPYQNIAAQAKRVAITNALVAMWPGIKPENGDPMGSMDTGDGYLLLGPKDAKPYRLSRQEQVSFRDLPAIDATDPSHSQQIYRWGRLKIPTGQIARSSFKELERCSNMSRTDRNVKVRRSDLI